MRNQFRHAAGPVCGARTAIVHVKFDEPRDRASQVHYYFLSTGENMRTLGRDGFTRLADVGGKQHSHTHHNHTGVAPARGASFSCVCFGARPTEVHAVFDTDLYRAYRARNGIKMPSLLLPATKRPDRTDRDFDPQNNLG